MFALQGLNIRSKRLVPYAYTPIYTDEKLANDGSSSRYSTGLDGSSSRYSTGLPTPDSTPYLDLPIQSDMANGQSALLAEEQPTSRASSGSYPRIEEEDEYANSEPMPEHEGLQYQESVGAAVVSSTTRDSIVKPEVRNQNLPLPVSHSSIYNRRARETRSSTFSARLR